MKRAQVVILALLLCIPVSVLAQGLLPGGPFNLPALTKNIKVNAYAQAGLQWLGSNLNLPVQNQLLTPFLNIGDIDIALKDANFWTGIVGCSFLAEGKYSLFGAAGGLLNRPFITSGTIPVSLGPLSSSAVLEFTNTNVESWFIQTGIGLGPILLGLYWDHFAFTLGDPRNQNGPIANQTLRGDILTKTYAPFIGISMPLGRMTATVTYSPFAYSNTALALISSQGNLTELRYTWNKPGNLLTAMAQYNTPITSSMTLGLWCNYNWMRMRQDATLEFENTPVPLISSTRNVTATMTKYAFGGGITLNVNF